MRRKRPAGNLTPGGLFAGRARPIEWLITTHLPHIPAWQWGITKRNSEIGVHGARKSPLKQAKLYFGGLGETTGDEDAARIVPAWRAVGTIRKMVDRI